MRLRGKVAIVTGGGGGIGQAIALRFAEEGADVVVPDVNVEGAALTVKKIEAIGRRSIALQTDVAKSDQVQLAVAETLKAFGHIDLLVNNAGINMYRHPFDFADADWQRIIDVNLTGTWLFCRYVGPHMAAQGHGTIVNIASAGWFQTSSYRAPYMASKGAVANLTRALALDLATDNIRVNAVAPGLVKTGMTRPEEHRLGVIPEEFGNWYTPMRRWASLEEVANVALFLASDEASYITGQILAVDGGLSAGNPLGREWPPSQMETSGGERRG